MNETSTPVDVRTEARKLSDAIVLESLKQANKAVETGNLDTALLAVRLAADTWQFRGQLFS